MNFKVTRQEVQNKTKTDLILLPITAWQLNNANTSKVIGNIERSQNKNAIE